MAKSQAQAVTALEARRDTILDQLAAMTTATLGGNANNGKTATQHDQYTLRLYEELDRIEDRLAGYTGPVEIVTEAESA